MDITIKDVPSVLLLSAMGKLRGFPDIPAFAQKNIPQIYAKTRTLGTEITGPETFLYKHFPDGGLELRVGVPVGEKKGDAGEFEYFVTSPVKCACCIHKGSMKTIGKSWDALCHGAKQKKMEFTDESREVYLKWVDFDSAENVTELQRVLK